jgi:hypothetical protein
MRLSVTNGRAGSDGQRQKNSTERPCKRALRAAALYDFGIFTIKKVENNLPKYDGHNSYTDSLTFTFTLQKRAPNYQSNTADI